MKFIKNDIVKIDESTETFYDKRIGIIKSVAAGDQFPFVVKFKNKDTAKFKSTELKLLSKIEKLLYV